MIDAITKSHALLMANLTPEQRREFEAAEAFRVKIKDETYELRPDITERLSDHARFCAIIPGLPVYDQMLARKLYLEHDPEAFFRAANHFKPCTRPSFNRIDPSSVWRYFRVALMRESSQHGMDPRLVEVRWAPPLNTNTYELCAIYAGRYNMRRVLDAGHLYSDNLAAVIDTEAQHIAGYISRMVDLEMTKGSGVMP